MRLVLHAGRSYYDELLHSGVKIYEYSSGILHAKSLLVDDRWATVGSANMDIRSFQLNFEVNAAVYGPEFAHQLAQLFHRDLTHARQITLEDLERRTLPRRMAEGFARVLSPVL
jgi:cardiolipin synthase